MRPPKSTVKLKFKRWLFKPFFAFGRLLQRLKLTRREPVIDRRDLRRIAVVQFGGLGDILRILPMLRILAENCPRAELFTLTDQPPWLFELLPARYPRCHHLRFDFGCGYLAKVRNALRLRRLGFDLLVVPSRGDGIVETAIISYIVGSRHRIGFDLGGSGFTYTHTLAFRQDRSILCQNIDILQLIGVTATVDNLELEIPPSASRKADAVLAKRSDRFGPLVAIHPWVAFEHHFRAWPMGRYVALTKRLLAAYPNIRVLLIGGPEDRARAATHFGDLVDERLLDLTGTLDFLTTAALVSRCNLLLCNDSSLLHIAEAFGVPTVALFGATPPIHVLPPASQCRVVQTSEPPPCQPCYRHQPNFDWVCPQGYSCMLGIKLDTVWAAVEGLITERRAA